MGTCKGGFFRLGVDGEVVCEAGDEDAVEGREEEVGMGRGMKTMICQNTLGYLPKQIF